MISPRKRKGETYAAPVSKRVRFASTHKEPESEPDVSSQIKEDALEYMQLSKQTRTVEQDYAKDCEKFKVYYSPPKPDETTRDQKIRQKRNSRRVSIAKAVCEKNRNSGLSVETTLSNTIKSPTNSLQRQLFPRQISNSDEKDNMVENKSGIASSSKIVSPGVGSQLGVASPRVAASPGDAASFGSMPLLEVALYM